MRCFSLGIDRCRSPSNPGCPSHTAGIRPLVRASSHRSFRPRSGRSTLLKGLQRPLGASPSVPVGVGCLLAPWAMCSAEPLRFGASSKSSRLDQSEPCPSGTESRSHDLLRDDGSQSLFGAERHSSENTPQSASHCTRALPTTESVAAAHATRKPSPPPVDRWRWRGLSRRACGSRSPRAGGSAPVHASTWKIPR